jgi:cytochrome c553
VVNKSTFLLLICLSFLSCKTDKKEVKEELVYDIYEPSEMSMLMNSMYEINEQIKKDIIDGKTPDDFPLEFLKIHTAELSDFKQRNETFESFSKLFVEKEKDIFNTTSNQEAKKRYNQAINLCISCHKTECTGPIPRIKKLLIK